MSIEMEDWGDENLSSNKFEKAATTVRVRDNYISDKSPNPEHNVDVEDDAPTVGV